MSEMATKSRAPALRRGFCILDYLQQHGNSPISEVITGTKIPRSSAYVLIEEMINLGLVRQNQDGTLQLWMHLIALGQAAGANLDIRDLVRPHLEALMRSEECLAVHYGVMDGDRAYYMLKLTSPKSGLALMSREGMQVSLVHAGLGKCLLAFQNQGQIDRIIPKLNFAPATPTSITDPEIFKRELALIKLQGWALDNSEGEAAIRCVAVPVFNHDHSLLGAVSIVGMANYYQDEKLPEIVHKAKLCAANITASLI